MPGQTKKNRGVVTASVIDPPVAADFGNSYSKLRYGATGQAIDFRSIMAPLSSANRINDWPIDSCMQFGGAWWVSGDAAYTLAPDLIQEDRTVNRYAGAWYKRLFAFGLHRMFYELCGPDLVAPRVISSIPAGLFRSADEVARIKDNLLGFYEIGNVAGGTLRVEIQPSNLVLVPEGFGTYAGLLHLPGGGGAQYGRGTWLIADPGYLTLDVVVFRDGDYMADLAESDEKTGISTVADAVRQYVFEQSRVRLGRSEIDQALSCDTLLINGRGVSIAEVRDSALMGLAARVGMQIEQWSAGLNLSGVILTGGGADYLRPFLVNAHLPGFTIPASPRRANVDGAFVYLTAARDGR